MHLTNREVSIIILILIIAVVRFFFFLPTPPNYRDAIGKQVSVTGYIINTPDIRLNNQRITVRPENQEANVLVVIPKESDVAYGDEVIARGELETPENFITSSGKEFNYERYLANQDIYYIVKNAEVEVVSKGNGSAIKSWLFEFRESFMKNIARMIAPPQSDLANGLILGARGGFDNEMREEFISTGTIHIIALSGYNVTIVAEGVMRVLGFVLASMVSIVIGIIVVLLFVIMAGASATAIRAGIMAIILLFARMTGRTYDAGRGLVIAGLIMIAYDLRVVTDISFQLSFIATAGVLFVTPKVIKWFKFLPMKFGFRELVATTVSATISVLPLLLHSTGVFSLVSLPANILILPFIPVTMLFSFLVGMIGYISPIVSLPFAYISDLLLSYILSIIHFFATLPYASVNIKSFPLIITLILYGLLAMWVFKKKP